jgi:hypothetical protein
MAKSRYFNTKIFSTDDKKRYYTPTFYPTIDKLENDTYITANAQTRLDILAHTYYGDAGLYWIIGICNGIEGSIFIEPGTQLCIPDRNRIADILSSVEILNK